MRPARLPPALLAAAVLLVPSPAAAQPAAPPKPVEIPADGFELFRALLERAKIQPVKRDEAWQLRRYDDVIVVVLGPPNAPGNHGTDPIDKVMRAVAGGGAALVATDTALPLRDFFVGGVRQHVWIESGQFACEDEKALHRGQDYCPYVVPLTPRDNPPGPDPRSDLGRIFQGDRTLTRVATNEPGLLRVPAFAGEFGVPLARFPRNTVKEVGGQGFRIPNDAYFAVGGEGPDENHGSSYRFLAMSDHSVFINLMLLEPGTDNLELAYRVIDYLQGPNKRKRCLFIENGRVVERFDELSQAFAKQRPLPGISPDKMVDIGNQFVDKLQQNNLLNSLVLGSADNPERRGYRLAEALKVLLVLAAVYMTWHLMGRAFGSRKPTDLPPPPAVAPAPAGPPGVFERRQKELLRRDNVYEPARDLVREFFASAGVRGTEHGPRHPRLQIAEAVRRPESLRLAVKDFWRLAYGPPQEVTVARWRELEPYFDKLRQAHAEGKWRFVLADAPVAATA